MARLQDSDLKKLLWEASEDHKHATPPPWRYAFAYNNGGCPTANLLVPGHNNPEADSARIEMLEDDARFITNAREREPKLAAELQYLLHRHDKSRCFSVSEYLANPGVVMEHVPEYGSARIVNPDGTTRMTLTR